MIRSDLSKPRRMREDRYTTAPKCYTCQKEAKRETVKHYSSYQGEKYQGPEEIKSEKLVTDEEGKVSYITEVYTGFYLMNFGNFCSLKCGLNWANHEINRRRLNKLEKRDTQARKCGNAIKPEDQAKLQVFRNAMRGKSE